MPPPGKEKNANALIFRDIVDDTSIIAAAQTSRPPPDAAFDVYADAR